MLGLIQRQVETSAETAGHLTQTLGTLQSALSELAISNSRSADVLARFGRMYPQVRLHVRVHLSGQVQEWLDDGDVDLALLQIPVVEAEPDDIVLWQEPLRWVHGQNQTFDPSEPLPVVTFGPGLAYMEVSEEALTAAAMQRYHVDIAIKRQLGARTGKIGAA